MQQMLIWQPLTLFIIEFIPIYSLKNCLKFRLNDYVWDAIVQLISSEMREQLFQSYQILTAFDISLVVPFWQKNRRCQTYDMK